MNKIFYLLVIGISLTYGSIALGNAESPSENKNLVNLGMLLPLSGNYSAIGKDTRQGIEIALAELNSPRISLIYGDSRTEPSHAINEFRKMLSTDKVLAVFAFRGPIGMAINPISQQEKISLLGGVGNKDFAAHNVYAFQFWPTSDQEGKFIANHLKGMNTKKIAILTVQDDWTSSVSMAVREELKKYSGKIVLDQEFLPNELDFQSTVTKFRTTNPDVIFANLGLPQIGVFISKLRQVGINVPVVSNFWINKPEVVNSVEPEYLEGVMFAEMSSNLPVLENELKKQFGSKPSGATISAYVATMCLGQVAKELSLQPTREEYYNKLLEVKKIKTASGDFDVYNRIVQFPLVMREFHNGKVTEFNNKSDT